MELDFFTGYHGSGKTYTAKALLDKVDSVLADTGPIMRSEFSQSGFESFGDWNKKMELEFGDDFSNTIVLNGIKKVIIDKRPKHLFIVGNRDIKGIEYIKNNMEDNDKSKILLFKKPFYIMKEGYQLRTGRIISDEEFHCLLIDDEKRGLLNIIDFINNNQDTCSIIESNRYDDDSINTTLRIIQNKE